MSDHKYPQVVRAVFETPWAILPSKLTAIVEMVALRAAGEQFTAEEIEARIGAGPARRDVYMAGSVAVLPMYGVITPKADAFTEMSGGTSVQRLQSAFREAMGNKDTAAVVFDIDSPGGMTDQITEFAAEIRSARGKKPIVAVSNATAASAAYWLGSQADEFYSTPSGHVGSIGVIGAHEDLTGMQEQLGVKTTLVTAGKYKAEGQPFEPLSDEARAAIQSRVDSMYGMFVADVAKGRRVAVDTVRKGFGEGRVVTAKQGVEEGMIDGIDTLESVVARVTRSQSAQSGNGRSVSVLISGDALTHTGSSLANATTNTTIEAADSGLSFASEADALRASAEALVERTRSLAELRRGRLSAAKRDQLSACHTALTESVEALAEVLAATDPDKDRNALMSEHLRLIERGGAR